VKPCDRYCALCSALKQHQEHQERQRKTPASRKRERWIKRLKARGEWQDKTQMKLEKDELKL
jgi:hypothetical protein